MSSKRDLRRCALGGLPERGGWIAGRRRLGAAANLSGQRPAARRALALGGTDNLIFTILNATSITHLAVLLIHDKDENGAF
jgi:hypothetical protein